MSDTSGGSGGSSYPGRGDQGSGHPGQWGYPGRSGHPGQQNQPGYPPQGVYGSPDPNSYLGAPSYPGGPYGYGTGQSGDPGWSGLAIAALIIAVLLPCLGLLVAVPLAIVALVKIGKSGERGKGLAISAIVIAALWVGATVALVAWVATSQAERDESGEIVEAGRIGFGDIRGGDCVSIPDLSAASDVDVFELEGVPCADEHNAEAAGVILIEGDDYPGQTVLEQRAGQECRQTAQNYLGSASPTGLQPYYLVPTESVWDDEGGHRVVCFIAQVDFSDTTGSVAGR